MRHGYIKIIESFLQVGMELRYGFCLVVREEVDSLLDLRFAHLVDPRLAIVAIQVTLSLKPLDPSAEGEIQAPEDTTGFSTDVRDVQIVSDSCSFVVVRMICHLQYGHTKNLFTP